MKKVLEARISHALEVDHVVGPISSGSRLQFVSSCFSVAGRYSNIEKYKKKRGKYKTQKIHVKICEGDVAGDLSEICSFLFGFGLLSPTDISIKPPQSLP